MSFQLKLLVFIFCFFAKTASAQEKNLFELKGNITGLNSGTIYLAYYDAEEQKSVNDSCEVINGNFHFSGNVNGTTVAFISLIRNDAFGSNATNIFLEPAKMNIQAEFNAFNSLHMTGSEEQVRYEALRNEKAKLTKKYERIFEQLEDKNTEDDFILEESLNPYYDSLNQLDYIFFANHPQSYLTLYLLQYHIRDLSNDSLALFYNRLGDKLHQNVISKRIAEVLKTDGKYNGAIGTTGAFIISKDNNGNEINSGTYKGKFLLLDFWASWCVPCRKNNPHLKELFHKYKDKGLVIIGIADDSDSQKWKEAIRDDGINLWPQILRQVNKDAKLKGLIDDNDINEKFGIETLPTTILINPDGIIIGRFDENIEELSKALAGIFK